MSIGSCTSCSPVIDAVKLSANPKADLNGDGKVTTTELQTEELQKASKPESIKDLLKTDTDSTTESYVSGKTLLSRLTGNTIALLSEAS